MVDKRANGVWRTITKSFWWLVMMQGLQDATLRRPITNLLLWIASLVAIFIIVRSFSGLNDAESELKLTFMTGLALAAVNVGYYVLRIPPSIFKGVLREQFWHDVGDDFARLQTEGQGIIDSFTQDTPRGEKIIRREAWRESVRRLCDELSPSWRAQFDYQGGLQKEALMAKMLSTKRRIDPTAVLNQLGMDADFEFATDFVTEIEQVKGFAKFAYDRAMETTKLK